MSIIDSAKVWLFGIALKKGIVSAAKLIVAYAMAHGINISFSAYGVTIDTTSEAAMTVALNSVLTMVKNWLKLKYPGKFGWL